jgi:hypothetical protein
VTFKCNGFPYVVPARFVAEHVYHPVSPSSVSPTVNDGSVIVPPVNRSELTDPEVVSIVHDTSYTSGTPETLQLNVILWSSITLYCVVTTETSGRSII